MNKRKLAGLLVAMMVLSMMPIIPGTVMAEPATYTEGEVLVDTEAGSSVSLSGFENWAALTETGAAVTGFDISGSNSGPFTSDVEWLESKNSYEFVAKNAGTRVPALSAGANGLTFAAGNQKLYGSTLIPWGAGYVTSKSPRVTYDTLGTLADGGAMKFTMTLENEFSRGYIDFNTSDGEAMDIEFDATGITPKGASKAAFAMTAGIAYDVVIKAIKVGTYAIYAKANSASDYTKVTEYDATYTGTKVMICGGYPTGNKFAGEVWAVGGTNTYWVNKENGCSDNTATKAFGPFDTFLTVNKTTFSNIATYTRSSGAPLPTATATPTPTATATTPSTTTAPTAPPVDAPEAASGTIFWQHDFSNGQGSWAFNSGSNFSVEEVDGNKMLYLKGIATASTAYFTANNMNLPNLTNKNLR